MTSHAIGSIAWIDLTVPDSAAVRDFYSAVVGWTTNDVPVGAYTDYTMHDADGVAVSGVCTKAGENAKLPSQWLMYVRVTNLVHAMNECRARGGQILQAAKSMGPHGRYCVIQDPAGAVCALLQPPTE
jgi:predicted enzyme related to lactoylglutathione lyase